MIAGLREKIALLHCSLTRFGVVRVNLNPIWKNRCSRLEHCLISLLFKSRLPWPSGQLESLFGYLPTSAHCLPSRWCHSCWRHSLVYAALQEQPGVRRQHSRATFSKANWTSVDKGSGSRLPDERFRETSALFSGGHGTTGLLPPPPSLFDHLTGSLLLPGLICQRKHLHPEGPYLGLCSQGNSVQGSSSVYTLIITQAK